MIPDKYQRIIENLKNPTDDHHTARLRCLQCGWTSDTIKASIAYRASDRTDFTCPNCDNFQQVVREDTHPNVTGIRGESA